MIKTIIKTYSDLKKNLNQIKEIEANIEKEYKVIDNCFLIFLRDSIGLKMYRNKPSAYNSYCLYLGYDVFSITINEDKNKQDDENDMQVFSEGGDEYEEENRSFKSFNPLSFFKKFLSHLVSSFFYIIYFLFFTPLLLEIFLKAAAAVYGFFEKYWIVFKIFSNPKRSIKETSILINKLILFSDMNKLIHSLKISNLESFDEASFKTLFNMKNNFGSSNVLDFFKLLIDNGYQEEYRLEMLLDFWKKLYTEPMYPLVKILVNEKKNIDFEKTSKSVISFFMLNESLDLSNHLESNLSIKNSKRQRFKV